MYGLAVCSQGFSAKHGTAAVNQSMTFRQQKHLWLAQRAQKSIISAAASP